MYFHADSKEIRDKQKKYVSAIAEATKRFADRHDCFPIAVGMEQLDRRACEMLSELYGGMPVLVSRKVISSFLWMQIPIGRSRFFAVSSR